MDRSNIKVRKMAEEDLDWVIRLGGNTPEFKTDTDAAQFFGRGTLERWLVDPNGVSLVAELGGKPAGFILGSYLTPSNDGYIHCTVVESWARRNGIGEHLGESALDEFSQKGPENHKCDHVFCAVAPSDEPMLSLKRKMGFEVGRQFHYVEIMLPRRSKES